MVIQSHLLEHVFANRGYDGEFLRDLDVLDDHPYPVGSEAAVELLKKLHDGGEQITFIPDYDMDGVMSGVVGMAGLAELGFYVDLFVPDPKEGYGFNAATVDRLMAEHPGTKAIMTADVGISCHEGVRRAKELGLTVIVTDHHLETAEGLPGADVVVDPMTGDEPMHMKAICGACVAYRVLELYAKTYGDAHTVSQIKRLRAFAGIGTVSDSMPMLLDNRQMVRDAVSICRLVYSDNSHFVVDSMLGHEMYRRAFCGLNLILSQFEESGKLRGPADIDEEFFGYYLAPVFNSVRRMGAEMSLAFGVFFGNDPKADAEELFRLNNERRTLTEQYSLELASTDQPDAPFVYFSNAPSGLMGLLASRSIETGKGPCLVVRHTVDPETGASKWSGSGRSPSWYPFIERTAEYRRTHEGIMAAGHNVAFGFAAEETALPGFTEFLKADVKEVLPQVSADEFVWTPDLVIATDGSGDTGINILDFLELMEDAERFRPFGPGFEPLRMMLRFRPDEGIWSTMGSTDQHLKVVLPYGLVVLCWNQAQYLDRKDGTEPVSVVGHLNLNEFGGKKTVQFIGDVQ